MTIFPGGKSTFINSPRHLTIRHARRVVAASRREAKSFAAISASETYTSLAPADVETLITGSDSGDEIDPLPAGQEQLNSYWAPGLEAGPQHRIKVSQTIDPLNGETPLQLEAEQDFFVDAPQFSLPAGTVHSTYPPAGYSDDHRILPHVVLTDPHLPWERLGSEKEGTNAELKEKIRMLSVDAGGEQVRNRVPWLVVFSFSQDELRLSPEDLNDSTGIFHKTSVGVAKPVKQSPTMTVNMSVTDLWALTSDVVTPVTRNLVAPGQEDGRGDFIFVKPDLFTSLFSTFDKDGKRVVPSEPDTSQYKYLSHVRKINGAGMALAGVEDTAVFSIVVGNRAGPLDDATSATMCVHLVSIEGVEQMKFPSDQQRLVALCSLYSWNYTVLPPNALNVPDAFEHLGRTLDVLRAPERIIAPLRSSDDKIRQRVARRLDDGYSLVKYRTQTGEATVALYRGPFTPTYVPQLEHITTCSNSGVDMQILDKDIGIMDITYSVAWQVGRVLALGDESFTAALGRLRTAIHKPALKTAKLQTVKDINDTAIRTRTELLEDLPNAVRSLAAIHTSSRNDGDNVEPPAHNQPVFTPGGPKKRWLRPRLRQRDIPNLSLASPPIGEKYPGAALEMARSLASSTTGEPYDETNHPQSTDWMIVMSWLVDRMFLSGVPAHCLLSDPTHLEPETLRFFRIDDNWVDAMIDGALSLGNHYGVDEDRVAIKQALNGYIGHTPDGLNHRVQIPAYGFYLRSDLVTMFPDLRVEVLADGDALSAAGDETPAGAPLLRHTIVADGVMMAFMDRVPGSAQFGSLVFTQPAHQQRFAVARGLDATEIKVDIRPQFTVDQKTRETDKTRHDRLDEITYHPTGDQSTDNIFVWDSDPSKRLNDLRILRLPQYADVQLKTLQEKMGTYDEGGVKKPYFQDTTATSALFAMQLNDPVYNLTIDLKAHPTTPAMAALSPPGDGSTASPELRTLKQLGTARPKRLAVDDPDDGSDSPREPDSDDDDGEAEAFQRHADYTPTATALSKHIAPHVRALATVSGDNLPTPATIVPSSISAAAADVTASAAGVDPSSDFPRTTSDLVGDPASSPKYDIRISSNLAGHWDVITLQKPNLDQDLIFSIVLRQNESSQYKLVELDLQIQLGPAQTSPNDENNYMMQNYTGPGAHMLTNLRFNILPSIVDSDEPVLRLRLLPRAAKGWIDVTSVRELGFLLGLARLNAPKSSVNQLVVESWADYCKDPSNPKLGPDNTIRIQNDPTTVTIVNPNWK